MRYIICSDCGAVNNDNTYVRMFKDLDCLLLCDDCADLMRIDKQDAIDMQKTEAELYNWGKL